MQVFHYVADQLKDVELFDSKTPEPTNDTGALYNDFDCKALSLLDDTSEIFSFSQTSNVMVSDDDNESITQEAVDYAILEEDKAHGIYYEHLQWESPLFDNYSEIRDPEYLRKVYLLATDSEGSWKDITISKEAISMFERRVRAGWEGVDSVFDAWLLRKGMERPFFDYHEFHNMYPNFTEQLIKDDDDINPPKSKKQKIDNESISESSSDSTSNPSESEYEDDEEEYEVAVNAENETQGNNTNPEEDERDIEEKETDKEDDKNKDETEIDEEETRGRRREERRNGNR